MYIEDDDIERYLKNTLTYIKNSRYDRIEDQCPCCHHTITFPIIARKSDIAAFKLIIHSACKVMDKHDITAHLLADITAECVMAIARKN